MKGLQHTDRMIALSQNYPTVDRLFIEPNDYSLVNVAQVPELNFVKPYFLSHYPYMGRNYVCSGTMKLFDESNMPYLGILIRDTVSGDMAGYRVSGQHYLPVHESVTVNDYQSVEWAGKTAYLIVEGDEWGVTDAPNGLAAIAIGRFIDRYHFRPNGIKWGDRFVVVDLDQSLRTSNNPVVVSENSGNACCFGDCKVTAYPRIKNSQGKLVTLVANAFSVNPIYDITRIEWCWSGQEETITVGGQTITQPKADAWGTDQTQTIRFDDYGEATVTIRIFLSKDGNCGCGCGESACCITKEIVVDVQPNAANVCLPSSGSGSGSGGGGVGVLDSYQLLAIYKDTSVATQDYVTGITIGGTSYPFGSNVDIDDTANIQGAILTQLTAAGVSHGGMTLSYTSAANDNENAILNIVISNSDTVINSIQLNLNGGAVNTNFTAV